MTQKPTKPEGEAEPTTPEVVEQPSQPLAERKKAPSVKSLEDACKLWADEMTGARTKNALAKRLASELERTLDPVPGNGRSA